MDMTTMINLLKLQRYSSYAFYLLSEIFSPLALTLPCEDFVSAVRYIIVTTSQ